MSLGNICNRVKMKAEVISGQEPFKNRKEKTPAPPVTDHFFF